MKHFDRFAPWLCIAVTAVFACLAREWRREALQSIALTEKAISNSSQWERLAKSALVSDYPNGVVSADLGAIWERGTNKWGKISGSDSNGWVKLPASKPSLEPPPSSVIATNVFWGPSTNLFTIGNYKEPSVDDYLPFLLMTEGETILELTKDWNIIVHGELIGRIVNCKFIPFQP